MSRLLSASLFVWLALAVPALAQDALADTEAHARFEAGRAAMSAGRAEDALADFRRAYELSLRPALLYNIGVAADRLRRDDEALEAFERYLADSPPDDVPNRAEVEARVAVLRETIRERTAERAEAEAEVQTQAPPPSDPGPNVAAIALLVTGAAVAIGGGVLVGVGAADRASVEGAPADAAWRDYAGAADRAPIEEGVGGAAIGVGAALAVVGAVMLAMPSSSAGETLVALRPFGAGAQLVVQW